MIRNIAIAAVCASVMAFAGNGQAGFDDFESFLVNQTVNGQGQWTVEDSFGNAVELFDEEIIDDGSGNIVWRRSNALASGSYSNQPFSSKPALVAGETGAKLYNDYGTNHTMPNNPPLPSATAASNLFYGAWEFKSATGGSQAGLRVAVSPGGTQSTLRMSFVRMIDTGSGFDLVFFDTTGTGFNGATIASGLDYTSWHKVEMFIQFVDGIGPGAAGSEAGNDIVDIVVDGALVHTGTTWESYFYNVADTGPAGLPRAVDSLLFRASVAAATSGSGFYFDNVETSNRSQAPAYSCDGFEPPMNLALLPPAMGGGPIGRKVKKNKVLPFKATLIDGDGNPVTDLIAPPVIQVFLGAGPPIPSADVSDEALSNGKRTDGNEFILTGDKWSYNLATKDFTAIGTYRAFIVSGDTSEYTIDPECEGLFVIETR